MFRTLVRQAMDEMGIPSGSAAERLLSKIGDTGGGPPPPAGPLYRVINVPGSLAPFQATAGQNPHNIFVVDVTTTNMNVNAPTSPVSGDTFTLKASDAAVFGTTGGLTLLGNGNTIDGGSVFVVNSPVGNRSVHPGPGTQGAATFTFNGTEWKVVWIYPPSSPPPPPLHHTPA